MVPRFALPELEAPIARVARRVDEAIEGLLPYGRSTLWGEAVAASLRLSRATTHLLRAQLVLLGSLAGGGPAGGARLERFATGVELLHLFMLVHDDVMDNAVLRRGQPTLRVALTTADPSLTWQEARDLPIVLGNLLNVLAMRHLTPKAGDGAGEQAAMDLVLEACIRAGAGQFHDLLGFRGVGDGEPELRREIVDKAAFHAFAAPFAAGLLLARGGAHQPAIDWGSHVGLAFQGADDLVDLVGSPAATGKDGLRDLLQGRPSLPLLFLRERAAADDRAFVAAIGGKQAMELGDRARLDEVLRACGVIEASAGWVRAEIAAAARVRESSGFAAPAQRGMAAIELGLLTYANTIVASAERDGQV